MTEQKLGWAERQANAELAKLQEFIRGCGGLDEAAKVMFSDDCTSCNGKVLESGEASQDYRATKFIHIRHLSSLRHLNKQRTAIPGA